MKRSLLPIALAAALFPVSFLASAAGAFQEFTINETVVGSPTVANTFEADKLNGSYAERLTVTGPNSFSAQAFGQFTSFLSNDGVNPVSSQLNGFGDGGYRLVAVFSASGAITGPNAFQSSTNTFSLYLDRDSDTAASLTDGLTAPVLSNTLDDTLLATAGPNLSFGTGNLTGPPGAFNIDWGNFVLTTFGKTYFVSPNPFYMNVRVNGDYDVLTSLGAGETVNITGDVSAVFTVPEPTTLALVGLALMGAGLSRRKSA